MAKCKDYSFRGLYDKMGYVTQKAVLFSDTIEGTLRLVRRHKRSPEGDVKKAIDISETQEFIDKMEEGLYSHIRTERRQCFRRVRNSDFSIAFDAIARNQILILMIRFQPRIIKQIKNCEELSTDLKGTTCGIVAQRIGTIRHADKIIVPMTERWQVSEPMKN